MRCGVVAAVAGCLMQLLLATGSSARDAQITGYVRDAVRGTPLIANVTLLGTRQGTVTDSRGFYRFFDAPPGTHRLKASAVGYAPQVLEQVIVTADVSASVDFILQPSDLEVGEIVIVAERMPLEQSQTTSKTTFSGREVQALPVTSFTGALATSPSVYRGFVRGGDPFHTRSYLDGVDITDRSVAWVADYIGYTPHFAYNRVLQPHPGVSTMMDPVVEAVEQASLFVGGYGVDYGGLAGAVTYALREGSGPLSGLARVRVSQLGGLRHLGPGVYADQDRYFAQRDQLAGRTEPVCQRAAQSYTWTPEKYEYGTKPEILASFGLGASLTDQLGFYVTGRWFDSHGRLPNQWTRQLTATMKLTYAPDPSVRINAVVLVDDKGRLFGWKNSSYDEVFRYFLEGIPLWDGITTASSLKLSHRLTSTIHHELQVSYTHDNLRRGFCDDNGDGVISPGENGDYLRWEDTSQVYRYMPQYAFWDPDRFFTRGAGGTVLEELDVAYGCRVARPTLFYDDFTQDALSLKWSGSIVAWRTHVFRVGAEVRLHSIGRTARTSALPAPFPDYKAYGEEIWTRRPKEYSLYIADNIELEGLFLNAGVRLDAIDRDAAEFVDWYQPCSVGTDGAGGPVMVPVRGDPLPVRVLVSPRIGVSHPIRDDASMYFSFSRAEAFAPYTLLYSNYGKHAFGPTTGYPVVSQEPSSASSYDLGIQWATDAATVLSLGAYLKEYQHAWAMGMAAHPSGSALYQYYITSAGTADTRGIEISLRRRVSSLFEGVSVGGALSYAFSYIKNLSLWWNRIQTLFSAEAGDSAMLGGALPFERFDYADRRSMNDEGWGYLLGGRDHEHRATFRLFVEFPLGFRLSALGIFASGFYYHLASAQGEPDFTPLQGPWTKQVDVRILKGFSIGGYGELSLFVDLINAFGWTNVAAMSNDPWDPTAREAWERDQDPTGGPRYNRPVNYDNVLVYGVPREVYFGVEFSF